MKGRLFSLSFLLLLVLPVAAQPTKADYIPDELIVVTREPLLWNKAQRSVAELTGLFPAGSLVTQCADISLREQSARLMANNLYYGTQFLVKLPAPTAWQQIADSERLLRSPILSKILLNHLLEALSSNPLSINDPAFQTTYSLNYNAAFISSGGQYTGQQHMYGYVPTNTNRVLASIIDVGLNFTHQDAMNAFWTNGGETGADSNNNPKESNGIDDDQDGYIDNWRGWDFGSGDNNPSDSVGHGTSVFGIMAARINNGMNTAGIITDTGATMVLDANYPVGSMSLTDFATSSAYNFAVSRNVKVINMSFGSTSSVLLLQSAIQNGIDQHQIVPVAAAGNSNTSQPYYPASYANVISVGAVNSSGIICGFSNYGDSLDIMHLGCGIYPSLSNIDNTSSSVFMGTSAATPGISGFCWWLKKIDTSFTVQQVTQMIRSCGSNHGNFNFVTGYGTFVRFDSLLRRLLLPDTVIHLNACTGMQPLPHSRYFQLADSAWYGHPAMTGDSINTNFMLPGTYNCFFTWKSEPRPNEYYYDTVAFKIVVAGSGGLMPNTVLNNPGSQVCPGFSLSTSGNTGGALKSWFRNGQFVGTGNTYTDTVTVPMAYSYFAVANLTTATGCWTKLTDTSNTVTVTLQSVQNPSLAISGPDSICQGSMASFQAIVLNAGNTPAYQWMVNGQPAGTNSNVFSSAGLTNTCIISCRVISTASCTNGDTVISSPLSVVVSNSLTPVITISAPSTTVCAGLPVSIAANALNAGPYPLYQWKVNGVIQGGNTSNFSYVPANNDIISCDLTPASGGCYIQQMVTSNSLAITASPYQVPSVNISPSGLNLCENLTGTLTASTNVSNATFQWYQGSTAVGANANSLGLSGLNPGSYNYTVVVTVPAGECFTVQQDTAVAVPVTVQPALTPSTSATAFRTELCEPGTDTFTAVSNIPGASWQWQMNGSDIPGAIWASYTIQNLAIGNPVFRCITTMPVNGCYTKASDTSNAIAVSVSPTLTPSATVEYTESSDHDSILLTIQTNYTQYQVKWYLNGFMTAVTTGKWGFVPATGAIDTVYAVVRSTEGCFTADSITTPSRAILHNTSIAGLPSQPQIFLMPNPFRDNIQVTGLRKGDHLMIFNAMGQRMTEWTMRQDRQEIIQLPEMAAGMYWVHTVSQTGYQAVVQMLKTE